MIQELTSLQRSLLTDLERDVFLNNFNRRPFKIGHNLSDNRLLSLEGLVELSKELPSESVEYNAGDLPITQNPAETPRNGLSIAETIERIENCNSWMVLKNVEKHPNYHELLKSCLAEIREYSDLVSHGMRQEQGFVFVSSPGSVTPFHIDPENNFLLQISGSKTVWMFGQNDREVLREDQVEDFFAGAHRNLEFKEEFRQRGECFTLNQGEALHFPVVAPHYVENGPEVSISFSVTFQTGDSADRQTLHRFNKKLRNIGITPSPVGASRWRDNTKLGVLRSLRCAKNLFISDKQSAV